MYQALSLAYKSYVSQSFRKENFKIKMPHLNRNNALDSKKDTLGIHFYYTCNSLQTCFIDQSLRLNMEIPYLKLFF